jgi:transcriptional regulator with XRE-family HTH domain
MATRSGGADRISTKAKLAEELVILGNVLADARERHGIKQTELAAKLGLPASYLSKIENGTRRLDVIELIQIAQAMGADAAELIADVERALGKPRSGLR